MNKLPLYQFWVQVGLTGTLALFCMFNLSFQGKGNRSNEALYSSILSLLVGYWLPSPANNKQGNNVAIDSEQTNVMTNSEEKDQE